MKEPSPTTTGPVQVELRSSRSLQVVSLFGDWLIYKAIILNPAVNRSFLSLGTMIHKDFLQYLTFLFGEFATGRI